MGSVLQYSTRNIVVLCGYILTLLYFIKTTSSNTNDRNRGGPSYEYEPFFYSRPRSNAGLFVSTQAPSQSDPSLDAALRTQNSHFRSIYRNKNYFVQSLQKARTYSPLYRNTFNPKTTIATTTLHPISSEEQSDSSILFGGTASSSLPSSSYIRTLEVIETTKSILTENQIKDGKGTMNTGKILYFPTPNGKTAPPCARNSLYCETFDDYPREFLSEVLSRSYTPLEFQNIYGETTDNSTTTTDLKLLERTGLSSSNFEETPLCSSVERTIYPRVARNKDNKWLYVVNDGEQYIQGVRVEKCLDEDGSPCVFGETAPVGYQTACRQKYIYKKLLALTPEGKTSTDTFKLPSCCVCFAKRIPLVNRILNTSPSSSLLASKKTSSDTDHNTRDDDDHPTTTLMTRTRIG